MRNVKWIEWGVAAALLGLVALPVVGHYIAGVLLAAFLFALLFDGSRLQRRLRAKSLARRGSAPSAD